MRTVHATDTICASGHKVGGSIPASASPHSLVSPNLPLTALTTACECDTPWGKNEFEHRINMVKKVNILISNNPVHEIAKQ